MPKRTPPSPDPLLEPLNLLAPRDLEGEDDDNLPEPPPSALEPEPLQGAPDIPEDTRPEPEPSLLDDVPHPDLPDAAPEEADTDEPFGSELDWAAPLEDDPALSDDHDADEAGGDVEGVWEDAGGGDDAEDALALWAGLEDEQITVIGYEERVDLPELSRTAVLARISSLHAQSELHTQDEALCAHETTALVLGLAGGVLPPVVARVVRTAAGEGEWVLLGRDVLGGRFLVDGGRQYLVSSD